MKRTASLLIVMVILVSLVVACGVSADKTAKATIYELEGQATILRGQQQDEAGVKPEIKAEANANIIEFDSVQVGPDAKLFLALDEAKKNTVMLFGGATVLFSSLFGQDHKDVVLEIVTPGDVGIILNIQELSADNKIVVQNAGVVIQFPSGKVTKAFMGVVGFGNTSIFVQEGEVTVSMSNEKGDTITKTISSGKGVELEDNSIPEPVDASALMWAADIPWDGKVGGTEPAPVEETAIEQPVMEEPAPEERPTEEPPKEGQY